MALTSGLSAAELLTWSSERQPLNLALTALGQLTPEAPTLAFEVATGSAGATLITISLHGADPAALRQALGHAAGLWWAVDAEAGWMLTADARPPRGTLRARTHPSALRNAPTSETLVRTLIAPWLGAGPGASGRDVAALGYVPDAGVWQATLDADGQAHLIELLTLLQQPTPSVPPLIPDEETPLPDQRLTGAVRVMPWGDWCVALATATNASVSLAPEVTSRGAAPAIAALTVADLPAALAAAGLRGRCIHGVWCISVTDIPEDREHPAQRRRLAIVPLAHLVPENSADPAAAAGARLATALRACVVPSAWNRPGWSLTWMATWPGLPAANGLLIAADPPTLHAVLDACDVLDRLGVEAGLEALAR